jgi:putative transposase
LHEEVSTDYNDMIYAILAAENPSAPTRLHPQMAAQKCKAVADSPEEAGDRLFTFTRRPSA